MSKKKDDDDNHHTSNNDSTNHCFLQVSIAGGPPQRIVIELFRDTCPRTCQNFAALCAAPGRTTPSQPAPTYRGSQFHRIVPQFMVQGGDFEHFSGTGGHSVLATRTFADESFAIPHDKAGLVSMANKGKDTNGSQFFITLQQTPHLNHKHVVFGLIVEGMKAVQSMATDVELEGTRPSAMQKIVIMDCGMGKGSDEEWSGSESNDDNRDKKNRKRKDKKKSHKKKRKKKQSKDKRKKHKPDSSDEGSPSDYDSDDSSSSSLSRDRKSRKKHKDHKRRKRSHSSSKRRRDDASRNSSGSPSSDDSRKRHRR